MNDLITNIYKELEKADKELSITKRNHDHLQKQLLELESIKRANLTAMEHLQKDIGTLNRRLINNEMDVHKECSDLEQKYGDLVLGNSLPDKFESLLNLSADERIEADKVLKRIVETHHGQDDHSISAYTDYKKRLENSEMALLDAQLKYGQLPETKEEIYALDEANPKDKRTIDVIMKLLGNDAEISSRKTWEEAKKEYQKVGSDYSEIRNIQKKQEEQIQNLLNADLDALRKNQNEELLTEESKTLINGALEKNAKSIGISSLNEFFKREEELYSERPDTRSIDELPETTHFFTDLGKMNADVAKKARDITNDLIKKYQETNPSTEGTADSIEDYENSEKMKAVWGDIRDQIAKNPISDGLLKQNDIDELSKKELQNKIDAYQQAQTDRKKIEEELAEKSLDVFPVKVTAIKELKEEDPLTYKMFSAKVRALAERERPNGICSLSGRSYDADVLIREHTEMRELERRNKDKRQLLTEQERLRLEELQGSVREMKERLEDDKKENTNFFGRRRFSDDQRADQERLKKSLEQKDTEIKTLKDDIVKFADAKVEKHTKEARVKKDYIKHTVVASAQKDALEKKKVFEKKVDEHKKLTEKVDDVLTNLKKEQEKKLEQNRKALSRDEALSKEKIKDGFVTAESTQSMIEKIKDENLARKRNESYQRALKDLTNTHTTTIKNLNSKLQEIETNVEAWVKEDKEARTANIQKVNKEVTKELSERIKTANKEARKAGTNAKVMGFISQKVGGFTDLYRKKIKEVSDGMIKAPRIEKEAQVTELIQKLDEARRTSAAMERNNMNAKDDEVSRTVVDEVTANKQLERTTDRISDIQRQITKLNQEIKEMKPKEEKRLQENEEKFNKIFGDVIPTDREQMLKASESKRMSEIAAAKGDPQKIERANVEFELRKSELDAKFDKEELENQKIQAEIQEIDEKSEEWGRILNSETKANIDTMVTIGEKIFNYAAGKIQGENTDSKGDSTLDIRGSLQGVKDSLSSSEAENEHVVDQLLDVGELVYQRLQKVNQSLEQKYQDASDQHVSKQNLHDALKKDDEHFQELCSSDVENKMGVSLKDKRIRYLNDMKSKVEKQLIQDRQDKMDAKADVQTRLDDLEKKSIPNKKMEISDASKEISSKTAAAIDLEKKLDDLRDDQLEQYRTEKSAQHMTDKQISQSAQEVMLRNTDLTQPISGTDLIEQITNTKLGANTSLEDTMEQIRKINVNGIGLINYVDPNNQYFDILSADEAEKQEFKDKLLSNAGTMLKGQLGSSIISVEQDDMLLHPVLLEGNHEFNAHTKSMVADFNAVRLDSAKMNVMKRSQHQLSDREEQKRQVFDKAVKQSRSRVSFSNLMEEDHVNEKKTHKHVKEHEKESKHISKERTRVM